jgi:plasmid stability protein
MAQILVRQLEERVKAGLKRRAERNGRSMEEEVREILRAAAKDANRPSTGLGARLLLRFAGIGLPQDLPEFRGQDPRAAELGK